jgi:hypothetical protein
MSIDRDYLPASQQEAPACATGDAHAFARFASTTESRPDACIAANADHGSDREVQRSLTFAQRDQVFARHGDAEFRS